MSQLIHSTMKAIEKFGTQEWMLLMIFVVICGFFCLRGFGSRSSY